MLQLQKRHKCHDSLRRAVAFFIHKNNSHMGIISKIQNAFTRTEPQAQKAGSADMVKSATLLSSIAGARQRANTQSNPFGSVTGWVFFALDKIAQRVASTDLKIYRYANGDVIEVDDTELGALLNKPNPFQSGIEFAYTIGFNLKLWGRAPIAIIKKDNTTTVMGLFPMRPDLMTTETDKEGRITGYKYSVSGHESNYKVDDVIDIKIPNAQDPRKGASAVLSAGLEIDADISTAIWNKHLIENGAQPAGVLETERTLTDESFARLQTQWENRYGGADNAGKVAILEAGLKYHSISVTPKELDYIETRKFNRDTILTLLGVPKALVIADDVNKANSQTAERVFAMETIEPLVKFITVALNTQLVPLLDETLWIEYEGVVPSDAEELRLDSQASTNVWATVNETRAKYGLAPLDGGDVLYLPFGLTPTMNAQDATKGMIEMRYNPEKKTLSHKQQRIKRAIIARGFRKRALVQRVKDTITNGLEKKSAVEKHTHVTLELKSTKQPEHTEKELGDEMLPSIKADRIKYLREIATYTKRFRKEMQTYFDEQKDEVVNNLIAQYGTQKSEKKEIDPDALFDPKANAKKLQKQLRSYYEQNIGAGATAVSGLLGTDTTDWVETPQVQDYLKEKPTKLAGYVNDTTLNALRDTLAEGVGNGDDLTALVLRIQSVYDDADGYRAETIARTEVGSAQNFGRAVEMQAQGVEKRMWVSAFINTRESHAEAHGQVVGVDEPFEVGGESLMYPQDPDGSADNTINCQCSVAPVLK